MNTTSNQNYGWAIAGVLVIVIGIVLYFSMSATPTTPSPTASSTPTTTEPVTTTGPTSSRLSSDLYPLYTGAKWGAPKSDTHKLVNITVPGVSVSSVPVTGTMDPGSIFTPFESYYAVKLAALGYHIDSTLAAGGATGGETGYRKGDALIILNYHTTFHTISASAPAQCPCDITLSLFSSK